MPIDRKRDTLTWNQALAHFCPASVPGNYCQHTPDELDGVFHLPLPVGILLLTEEFSQRTTSHVAQRQLKVGALRIALLRMPGCPSALESDLIPFLAMVEILAM